MMISQKYLPKMFFTSLSKAYISIEVDLMTDV